MTIYYAVYAPNSSQLELNGQRWRDIGDTGLVSRSSYNLKAVNAEFLK